MAFISNDDDEWDLFSIFLGFLLVLIPYIVVKIRRSLWIPNLSSKYVLVTGCDTGFGHEIALKLDKLGCHVFACCLTEKGENELRKHASDRLLPLSMDVTKQLTIDKSFDIVTKKIPQEDGLWGIVQNAGILGPTGRIEWFSIEDYWKTLDVNFMGFVRVNNTFGKLVKKTKGRIVHLISVFGRFSFTGMPYNVSKFAATAYADGVRRDMRIFDVMCSSVEPGCFSTTMTTQENLTKAFNISWDRAPAHIKEEYEPYYNFMAEKMKTISYDFNKDLSLVADAVIHGLFARFPKDRYLIGFDSCYIFRFLILFPDWLSDFLISKFFVNYCFPLAKKMN